MRRAWMVRAGEGAAAVDAMRAAGRIGVPYEQVGNAREWSPQRIEYEIKRDHPDAAIAAQMRSGLLRFASDMTPGDLVVIPNTKDREIWVSIVTGPYEFSEEPVVPHYPHTRTVEWLGWLDRDSSWLHDKLKYIDTPAEVVELRGADWWFDKVESVDLPKERPLRTYRTAAAPTRTPSRRAPAKPKPVVPKKPEMILCAGACGLQWRPASLVGGLCPDCRGD